MLCFIIKELKLLFYIANFLFFMLTSFVVLKILNSWVNMNVAYLTNKRQPHYYSRQTNVCIPAVALPFLVTVLKLSSFFVKNICVDIVVCDRSSSAQRFIVYYVLGSIFFSSRVFVRVLIDQFSFLSSIAFIFCSASWLEREAYDMFGLFFYGNSDLRRILTDYGFSGFPLRKDYPLIGFTEKQFSLSENIIISRSVVLVQEFRFND